MVHAPARIATLIFLLAAAKGAAAAERCAEIAGRVVAVDRLLEVATGPVTWQPVRLGDAVCVGDLLRAGGDDRVVVRLEGGGTVQLAPGTTVRIREAGPRTRTLLGLLQGVIRFFGREPQDFEVETPFATAAVEGTEFAVALDADAARVAVLEGRVRLSNQHGALGLSPGDTAVAAAGRAPELELRVRPKDAVRWALYYPPLGETRLPPAAPAALREAARLEAEGRRTQALARLEAVPPGGRDAVYHTLRAQLLLGQGRPEEALQALGQAFAAAPDDPDALALRSLIGTVGNAPEQALADARHAVARDPASSRARLALSYAAQAAFDLPLARDSLEAAVQAAPGEALAWARLAEVRLMQGDMRAARHAAEEAAALDPASARAATVLGFVALARIDTPAARAAFARALALQSFNPLARLGLGLATIRDGELAAGREQIELAVALDPGDALIRSYLGKAYLEERRDRLAGDELATAKALDPNDPTPWFYDAIRKQRDNRPVEALRDLEEAIGRNDNRAVYRSRQLLDQDLASRGTALARVYSDLGLQQAGVATAARSLAAAPTNAAAHRFLADTLARLPDRETARDSELLLARLLEPLPSEPIRPRRGAEGQLLTQTNAVLQAPDLYSLAESDGPRLVGEAYGGTSQTYGGEAATAVRAGRAYASVGAFRDTTNGVRSDNDWDTEAVEAMAQYQALPGLKLLAGVRHRRLDVDDAYVLFDRDTFFENYGEEFEVTTHRVGVAATLSPSTILLATGAESVLDDDIFFQGQRFDSRDRVGVIETRLFHSTPLAKLSVGGSGALGDTRSKSLTPGEDGVTLQASSHDDHLRQGGVFVDSVFPLPWNADLQLGMAFDHFEDETTSRSQPDPYIGGVWQPSSALTLRLAAFRNLRRSVIDSETIEPATVAGFSRYLDDFTGTDQRVVEVGIDARLGSKVYAGLEFGRSWHKLFAGSPDTDTLERREWSASGYLGWLASDHLVLESGFRHFSWRADEVDNLRFADRVDTTEFPLGIRYFLPSGLSLALLPTYVRQDGHFASANDRIYSGKSSFWTLDFGVRQLIANGRAALSIEGRNLLDEDFSFQDADPRLSRYRSERLLLVRIAVQF